MDWSRKSTQTAFQAEIISLEQIVPRVCEVESERRGVQKSTGEFDAQLTISRDNRFWEGRCHEIDCSKIVMTGNYDRLDCALHDGWIHDLMDQTSRTEANYPLHISK